MFMMLHKSLQQKLQRNLLMELIEINPRATMSLKPGGCDVQNIDLRWILAPSSKVEITDFGGGMNCCDIFLASIFLSYVEPKLFSAHAGKFFSTAPT